MHTKMANPTVNKVDFETECHDRIMSLVLQMRRQNDKEKHNGNHQQRLADEMGVGLIRNRLEDLRTAKSAKNASKTFTKDKKSKTLSEVGIKESKVPKNPGCKSDNQMNGKVALETTAKDIVKEVLCDITSCVVNKIRTSEQPTKSEDTRPKETISRSSPILNLNSKIAAEGECKENLMTSLLPIKTESDVPVVQVQLRKAKNPWRPTSAIKRFGTNKMLETSENCQEKLVRKLRAVLNKLAQRNLDRLEKKFNNLPINTEEDFKTFAQMVLERAVDEPRYCPAYARLCKAFQAKTTFVISARPDVFTKLLQDCFLGAWHKSMDTIFAAYRKAKTFEDLEGPKRSHMGLMTFFGQLYLIQMVNHELLDYFVAGFLTTIDDLAMECLCCLLKIVGKGLEEDAEIKGHKYTKDQGWESYSAIFEKLEEIAEERRVSNRVRFILQDLVDLRRNLWISKRLKDGMSKRGEKVVSLRLKKKKKDSKIAERNVTTSFLTTEDESKPYDLEKVLEDLGEI